MTIERKSNKLPISAFIICKNEEDRISSAIKSVIDIVDELIVVDSGSTDQTIEIARKLGASKIVFNEWKGYGQQKLFAESKCKNKWVLNLDADEELTTQLKQEIFNLFKSGAPKNSAYYVSVKIASRITGKVPKIGPEDVVIRLYDKSKASYSDHTIHDSVRVKSGTTAKLKGYIKHSCFKSYSHAIEKINYYTDLQAIDLKKKKRVPSALRIVFEPLYAFVKAYLINRYIFMGLEGFIEAVIYAFSKTIRLAKAREYHFKNGTLK